jgi:RNA polymerase sigma-70 factor (ECF subfamily)
LRHATGQQIFRFLLASLRDPDAAETLTQDCLLKAHRNWASFRGESSVMTWLLRIAINLQKDHWRSRRMQFWKMTSNNCGGCGRRQPVAAERGVFAGAAGGGAGPGAPGLESGEGAERAAAHGVHAAACGRDGDSRDRYTIGLSEGTVKAHLSRAMVRVRTELGGKR